jgi:type IV pilus assembly protein PilE
MHHQATRPTGFTLIEVMIVVAVVALLAGIALPSYQEYVRRAHRAHAQATLCRPRSGWSAPPRSEAPIP